MSRRRIQFVADHLADQVVEGRKTASVVALGEVDLKEDENNDPLVVGEFYDVVDSRGERRTSVRITGMELCRWDAIPERLWRGETNTDADEFRADHVEYFHDPGSDFEFVAYYFERADDPPPVAEPDAAAETSAGAPGLGTIGWHDLTVPDADGVRAFYEAVIGWTSEPVDMGEYSDHTMVTPAGESLAGICHARGTNADIPPQWMLYFMVADADRSAERVAELGGEIVVAPRGLAGGRFCVIRDPAGAVCALYQA